MAAEYFHRLEHRNTVYLGLREGSTTHALRRQRFVFSTAELGVPIPERLSILGFENIEYAALPNIRLSTLSQNPQLAQAALLQLLWLIMEGAAATPGSSSPPHRGAYHLLNALRDATVSPPILRKS